MPPQVFWYDAVQVVLLLACISLNLWLVTRSIRHGERLVKLETVVGNHYQHRFDQLSKHLNLEWQDTDDEGD